MKTCPLCDGNYPNQHATCPTDGALLIEVQELEPGTVIRGKYRIVRLLGRGGMGTVYLAEHLLLGRQRALKFISRELSRDSRFLKRFRQEAQAAVELQHPNIVQVVDLDQAEDGSPYIAMEYVNGPDLRLALAGGALAVERSLAIARGLALGLGAAHAKGVIHRDVKPENVLLAGNESKAETPKLLDFGIAAMKESATAISRTRGLMLTPEYAAPEQWRGMAAEEMDGRVDLYALGGVLYEMLTGQTAFHSHNSEGWMYQHLQNEPQAPSRLRPELGNWTGLDSLVLGLLAKDREQRPRDAAELYGLLEGVQDAGPQPRRQTVREEWPPPVSEESARAETGPEGASRSEAGFQAEEPLEESDGSHREKSGVWRIFAALLALAVIGFGAWFFFGKHPGKPSHAEAGVPPNSGICVAYPSDRPDESEDVAFVQEMPEFFGQMGMSLLQGRSFVGSDRSGGDPVVIVAAAAAKRWWPDRSPIGQTIRLGNQHDWRIIGVVSNPPIWSKSEKLGMEVYAPVPQVSFSANPGSGLGSATGTPQAQPPEAHNPPQSKPVSALDETREKAASSSPPAPSRRVEISPGVAAGMLLQKTTPVYPPIAKAARVSGTVVLQAVISKTGSIEDLRVISGPAMLQQAALDAVRTWRYEPYVMNGAPVEVLTTVNVIFNLGG